MASEALEIREFVDELTRGMRAGKRPDFSTIGFDDRAAIATEARRRIAELQCFLPETFDLSDPGDRARFESEAVRKNAAEQNALIALIGLTLSIDERRRIAKAFVGDVLDE